MIYRNIHLLKLSDPLRNIIAHENLGLDFYKLKQEEVVLLQTKARNILRRLKLLLPEGCTVIHESVGELMWSHEGREMNFTYPGDLSYMPYEHKYYPCGLYSDKKFFLVDDKTEVFSRGTPLTRRDECIVCQALVKSSLMELLGYQVPPVDLSQYSLPDFINNRNKYVNADGRLVSAEGIQREDISYLGYKLYVKRYIDRLLQ